MDVSPIEIVKQKTFLEFGIRSWSLENINPKLARRIWTIISLLVIIPIGFYSKFYTGPGANWVNNSLGGVFYEIFWCLVVFLFWPNSKPWIIALSVLIVTCCLEIMQLWHPPFLKLLRSSFIGRTILGTSFTWSDFPYYVFGCGLGWLCLKWLQRFDKQRKYKKVLG